MTIEVGDNFGCPEGHKAKIVRISEDGKTIAVRCPQNHFHKVVRAYLKDRTKPTLSYRNQPREERRTYVKNMVFLIKI